MRILHLAAGVAMAGWATSSWCYQADFHYGMTYWLGVQAGLTPEESAHLASGNEWKDSGMLDARPVVAYNVCVREDPTAFALMRENHFRAHQQDPAPPPEREISAASAYGEEEVRDLIARATPWPDGSAQALNRLLDFGGALHGYQDTFSHQGVSQVPAGCSQNYAWTHPQSRNGDTGPLPNWLGTGADQTYRWRQDCLAAAKGTFRHLLALVAGLLPDRKPLASWDARMARSVEAFCAAETKSAKVDWLIAHQVPQEQGIAASTTLKAGTGSFHDRMRPVLELKRKIPVTPPSEQALRIDVQIQELVARVEKADVSPQVRSTLEAYMEALVKEPMASLPQRLGPLVGAAGAASSNHPVLASTQRLRFVDRGLATENPIPLAQLGATDGDIAAVAEGLGEDWQRFYVAPRGQSERQPYILGVKPGWVVAFMLLRHAPYEVVRIELKDFGKSASVAGVDVLDFH